MACAQALGTHAHSGHEFVRRHALEVAISVDVGVVTYVASCVEYAFAFIAASRVVIRLKQIYELRHGQRTVGFQPAVDLGSFRGAQPFLASIRCSPNLHAMPQVVVLLWAERADLTPT